MLKNIFLKRINWLRYIFIIIICFFVGLINTKASTLEYARYVDLYSFVRLDGNNRLFYLKLYQFNNKPVYCIELGKDIVDYEYTSTDNYESLGFSEEQISYIQKIAYYGYEYEFHNNIKYYMAAQELIWEYLTGLEVYWTTEVTLDNPSSYNIDSYKEEILRLVNENEEKLNMVDSEYFVGEDIKIIDSNNVLSNYEIIDSDGLDAKIVDNSIIVNNDGYHVGDYTITLRKKRYVNNDAVIFYNSSSQKLFSVGYTPTDYYKVKVKIKGVNLHLQKLDSLTESIIPSGDCSLEGAKYELYNDKGELVDTLITDSNGQVEINNLMYGLYTFKEVEASTGYELDDNIYYIKIDKKDNNFTVLENPIMKKVEIYKTYGEDNLPESNVIFDFYKEDLSIYTSLITDNNGYGSVNLPLDRYTIKQRNSLSGYSKVDDIILSLDNNSNNIITYKFNDKRIDNPKTYDGIIFYIITFIISISFIFSYVKRNI